MTASLVALRLPPGPAFVAALDRVWARGDAALPLPPTAPEVELARTLAALRPSALLEPGAGGKLVETPLERARPVGETTALVVPTSGSTGEPKGVVLSHAALAASTAASTDRLGCRAGQRWLLCLPVHHVAGIQVLLRSRHLGTEPVLQAGFDVEAVATETAADWVSLVPTQLRRLLDAGADLARFAGILLGGAPPTPGLLEEAAAAGARVTVSYGMTETCGGCVYDGLPLPGVAAEVGDDGRVALAGPVLMDGYHGRPELTGQVLVDGWLLTSDRGRWSSDGRLEILGRADDVIITGGENIDAGTVTAAVARHPRVAAAAVVGRDDPEWGQRVVAVCELTPGAELTLTALRGFLADELPAPALPRELVTVETLPRDGMGKLRRGALERLLAQH